MISDDVHVLHGALQKTLLKSSGKKAQLLALLLDECEWLMDNADAFDDGELYYACNIYYDIEDRYISACQMPDDAAVVAIWVSARVGEDRYAEYCKKYLKLLSVYKKIVLSCM